MRSRELAQNFLRNPRVARRLVDLADGPHGALCVDLGAGKGAITKVALTRGDRVLAIEKDDRLVRELTERFGGDPALQICHGDLLAVQPPPEPYVCVGSPPFNISTELVRRWMTTEHFMSGAIIVEREFGRRITGHYGTTKLSASLGPFLSMQVVGSLRPADFQPQPRVHVAILTAARLTRPLVPWDQRRAYWLFVNYLFERGRLTVGASLAELRIPGLPRSLTDKPVREASIEDAIWLFDHVRNHNGTRWSRIESFERRLASNRRALDPGPA
jgi:23S rRNA (adenine-N6)-dimethyltransferase